MTRAGFIVHAAQAFAAGRPVVDLYCRTADGEAFVVRDTRAPAYFYVPATFASQIAERNRVRVVPTTLRTFAGEPVARIELDRPRDVRPLADTLAAAGIPTYEADLRHTARYTIDRDLRGALRVSDTAPQASAKRVSDTVLFVDPEIAPATTLPKLRVLSIDIETTPNADRVLSIALHGSGDDVVLFLGDGPALPCVRSFGSERDLLRAFVAAVAERDPDVITGWNVIDFDLTVLRDRGRQNGVDLRLGRDQSGVFINPQRSFWNASSATITGRVVLDGMALVRNSFVAMEELSLDFVSERVLGEGKTVKGPERVADLQRMYAEDPAAFVEYNLKDAILVTRIIDKLDLLNLAIERSLLTGMPLDRVAGSIASFDSLYLGELHRRGYVAPSVSGDSEVEPNLGGLVLEPAPGLYDNALVVDFKSLYPSLIRTFQIDPLGHALAATDSDPIVAPNGARFSRAPGILPEILNQLFPRREDAKRRKNEIASHAIKILMNSLYGVLGSPACRFHSGDIANAITGFGREILLWTKGQIEATGRTVLYGDTDSLFVHLGSNGNAAEGHALVETLNDALAAHIAKTWRTESKLELEFDTLYTKLFLPKMRQRDGGARKRYAGLIAGGEVVFTGMEVVRRDWTELAKIVQRELYQRLFTGKRVEAYLKDIVDKVKRGELDAHLVYKKALRKPLDSYTASTPPHVAAARKLTGPPPRLISYVITSAGPEPASDQRHPLDRAHYIDKQIRPVAEPVLDALGLDFDTVAETSAQLRLL
ncbi:MAG: DNA polymerase II [Deltaproteobacteria bacterium]|nr:DNA polymerase II [Deltaproteobacteria bacterium]